MKPREGWMFWAVFVLVLAFMGCNQDGWHPLSKRRQYKPIPTSRLFPPSESIPKAEQREHLDDGTVFRCPECGEVIAAMKSYGGSAGYTRLVGSIFMLGPIGGITSSEDEPKQLTLYYRPQWERAYAKKTIEKFRRDCPEIIGDYRLILCTPEQQCKWYGTQRLSETSTPNGQEEKP